MTAGSGCAVRCTDVGQRYDLGGESTQALADVYLEVEPSERLALFGPSGSGKSTLMALLAGLRRPTSGRIWIGDDELTAMSERQLLGLRGSTIGIVLQNPSRTLLPYGTVEDNIRFAQRPARQLGRTGLPEPSPLLRQLGLGDLAGQHVAKLSGGEQQRLSVAVAMAGMPRLLLADEPTSQLDGASRDRVVTLLTTIADEFGATMIVVTHDPVVADALGRRVTLADGKISADSRGSLGRRR